MVESDGYLHYTQRWVRPRPVVPRKPLPKKLFENAPPIPGIVKIAQELRFSEGEFWQTELGQAVLYFSLSKAGELTYPITAQRASSILGFRSKGAIIPTITWMVGRKTLKEVEQDPSTFRLHPQQVILIGLTCLYMGKRYPVDETARRIAEAVEGTTLAQFTSPEPAPGGYMTSLILDAFSKDSPWRKFPLEDFVNLGGQNEVVLGQAADLVSKES